MGMVKFVKILPQTITAFGKDQISASSFPLLDHQIMGRFSRVLKDRWLAGCALIYYGRRKWFCLNHAKIIPKFEEEPLCAFFPHEKEVEELILWFLLFAWWESYQAVNSQQNT